MNTISLIAATFLGVALAVFATKLLVAIYSNVMAGIRYRKQLSEKLFSLRLGRMLGALGINTREYLHKESVVNIHNQMSNCAECNNTTECDDNLARNTINIDNIDFCNNEAALKNMASPVKSIH